MKIFELYIEKNIIMGLFPFLHFKIWLMRFEEKKMRNEEKLFTILEVIVDAIWTVCGRFVILKKKEKKN